MDCHRVTAPIVALSLLVLVAFHSASVTCLFAQAPQSVKPRVRIDSVYARNDTLLVDLFTQNIMDGDLLRALTRGATSAIVFELRLWKSRKFFPDALVDKWVTRAKIYFEPLEMAYAVVFPDSASPVFVDIDDLPDFFARVPGLPVTDQLGKIAEGSYYVTASVVVEPLAVESYREIERWLRGEAKAAGEDLRRAARRRSGTRKNRLLRALLELTGFGDRVYSARSLDIRLPSANTQRD